MRLSLHQLNVFRAIADQGGITAATHKLHMTQPAVSNILKQLQDYYQQPLIEVIAKKVYLTEAGKVLYQHAVQVDQILQKAATEVKSLGGGVRGDLKLAVVSTAKYFVPRLLGAFKRAYPEVNITLEVLNREQVIEQLKQNQNDFVIMSQPPLEIPIEVEPFYEDQLVVACVTDHPLLHQKNIAFSVLSKESWLMREKGSGTRMVMLKWMHDHQIVPNSMMEIGNNESIKQLLMAGMGISLLSKQSIEIELAAGLIAILPVKDLPLKHEWYMVRHVDKQPSNLVRTFYEFVQQHPDLGHFLTLKNQTLR